MNRKKKTAVLSSVALGMTALAYLAAAATAQGDPTSPTTPSGQTYGHVPTDAGSFPVDAIPDLVAVVADNGVDGYVKKQQLFGNEDVAPTNPEQALAQQAAATPQEIPVFSSGGVTVVGQFTIQVDGPQQPVPED